MRQINYTFIKEYVQGTKNVITQDSYKTVKHLYNLLLIVR